MAGLMVLHVTVIQPRRDESPRLYHNHGGGTGRFDYRLQNVVQHIQHTSTLYCVKTDGQCSDRKASKHPLHDRMHGCTAETAEGEKYQAEEL